MVTIDAKEIEKLVADIPKAFAKGFQAIAEDGRRIIENEIPQGAEGKLKKAIETDIKPDSITYTVSRKVGNFDIAVGVVEGTGIYGPRKKRIVAKNGKSLKIPVANLKGIGLGDLALKAKDGFVFLKSIAGQKPNPFDQRALKKMEAELPEKLANAVIDNL